MKKLFLTFSLLAAVLSVYAGSAEDDIKSLFDNYKKALLSQDGEKAFDLITDNTKSYYNDLLEATLTADKATLKSMSLTDKMTVLVLRHKVDAEQLRSFDGKDLFVYAVNQKMIGSNIDNIGFGTPEINGSTASASLVMNGMELPAKLDFAKEEGVWKVDVTSLMVLAEKGMQMMVQSNNMSEEAFIDQVFQNILGGPVPATLWEPVGK